MFIITRIGYSADPILPVIKGLVFPLYLVAYIGGPVIAWFLADFMLEFNPAAWVVGALFFPVITLPILACKGLAHDFLLTKWERTWALHQAIQYNELEKAAKLVNSRVNLNFTASDGDSLLILAYRQKRYSIVKDL